jgi:hypothetical protein
LLKKALGHSTRWCDALAKSCSALGVLPTPNGFLAMGVYGRAVKCTRVADGREMALKVVVDLLENVQQLEVEFASLLEGGKACPEHVIHVEAIAPMDEVGGFHCRAYTMELGEPVGNVSDVRVRVACMMALLQLHLSGRCHGDARVSNLVTVGQSYKWIDFMLGAGRDGSGEVRRDAQMLVRSLYGRDRIDGSLEEQLGLAVLDLIIGYGYCFDTAIDLGEATSLMESLIKACESEFINSRQD